MAWPPPIKPGDKVSIISPAGLADAKVLERGCQVLRSWGLEPILHPPNPRRQAYLSGSDSERASAFLDAFLDRATKAVVCLRGGYGSSRILPLLREYLEQCSTEKVAALHEGFWASFERKRFLGFSDVTALHSFLQIEWRKAFPQKPQIVTFHSPMPASTLFVGLGAEVSKAALQSALFEDSPISACPPLQGRTLRQGAAEKSNGLVQGTLVGGNLTILASLVGTPWELPVGSCILFIEDVDEQEYRVDRMLTQLMLSSRATANSQLPFDKVCGLALGRFTNLIQLDNASKGSIDEVVRERYGGKIEDWFWLEMLNLPRDLPIIADLPAGHVPFSKTLPLGVQATMDLKSGILSFSS